MKLVSKYKGTCYKCGQPIAKGDPVNFIPDQNISHWDCPVQATPYDNSLAACRTRALASGLPVETTRSKNRPCLVQCICGHTERFDLWPRLAPGDHIPENDEYLTDEDATDEAILAKRASYKCSDCLKVAKHKTAAQLKRAEKARERKQTECTHEWTTLSHEERKCSKCGAIEFYADID